MSEQYEQDQISWTIGDRLRKARVTAGISVAEMALAVGRGRNTITNYEHGHRKPDVEAVVVYSDLTGFDLRWLASGKAASDKEKAAAIRVTEW